MSVTENIDQKTIGRRKVLTAATGVLGAVGAAYLAVPFLSSWQPSEKAKASGAPVDADIGQMQPGQLLTLAWRGKPVWVVRRTPDMLSRLESLATELRDPKSEASSQPSYCQNTARASNPEYFVVVGICTHLGCAPLYRPAVGSPDVGPDWQGGFFCPCHGSTYDLAGRVFKGVPAPMNLEVPPYNFISETRLRVGEDPNEGGQA